MHRNTKIGITTFTGLFYLAMSAGSGSLNPIKWLDPIVRETRERMKYEKDLDTALQLVAEDERYPTLYDLTEVFQKADIENPVISRLEVTQHSINIRIDRPYGIEKAIESFKAESATQSP